MCEQSVSAAASVIQCKLGERRLQPALTRVVSSEFVPVYTQTDSSTSLFSMFTTLLVLLNAGFICRDTATDDAAHSDLKSWRERHRLWLRKWGQWLFWFAQPLFPSNFQLYVAAMWTDFILFSVCGVPVEVGVGILRFMARLHCSHHVVCSGNQGRSAKFRVLCSYAAADVISQYSGT